MPKTYLKQTGFTYCPRGPLTINKEKIKKSKEIGDS